MLIRGRVLDGARPVSGATVRWRGREASTISDARGDFTLRPPPGIEANATITAAKEGYFIAGVQQDSTAARNHEDRVEIALRKLPAEDCAAYRWVDPHPNPDSMQNCGNCHPEIYEEWRLDAHSRAVQNRRLINLYDGSDWQGRPDRGWSLLAEYPHGAGVCTSCHAPTVEPDDPAFDDLRQVSGVAAEGVHCDLCHKIQDVDVEHAGLAHGRFGLKWLRPETGQIFFGPLDDVDRDEDVFSPLERESRFCASCHEGIVFGVPVYTTWSEWLSSPARREGRQCQHCHMPPTGQLANVAPGAGGIDRSPNTLASHQFLPEGRQTMLKRALKLSVAAHPSPDEAEVKVGLLAHDVGHSVPTGFIDRHLLLCVEALDAEGRELSPLAGSKLPEAAGQELAGQPGQLFAKWLRDASGKSPVPFWRAGSYLTDQRLQPGRRWQGAWRFPAQAREVRVRLWYRRFWADTVQSKGWPDDTLLVFDRRLSIEQGRANRAPSD